MTERTESVACKGVVNDNGCGVELETDVSGNSIDEEDVSLVDGQSTTKTNVSHDQNNTQYMSPVPTIRNLNTRVDSNDLGVENHVEPPKVGMVFKSWQDVEAYYKAYAEQQGFGVTRAQGVYSKGEVRDRITTTWRCECHGRPDMRARREAQKRAKAMDVSGTGGVVGGIVFADELRQRKRKSKKCECQAKVYASLNRAREWVIKSVELTHTNHTPSPGKAKLVKEYRMKKFTTNARKQLLRFFDEGVPVSRIHGCLSSELEGQANMDWTVKDLQHEVYKARRELMVGGDASAMMCYLKSMKESDQNFYHSQRLDGEGRLKDVLWVDARSRAAYEDFGDVVCFDATYLTNEYDLPFVNFAGVNHHGKSILLGCALVSREDCDTFKWIFKEWMSCMNNRAPAAILTDQAAAMRKPLEEVMPLTRHRWCIWHIMRKIPEKLGKCARYTVFKGLLKAVVYESLTVEEFESGWTKIISDFKLESNDWLTGLYSERHMWVPAYMRYCFWAGMKTTQRVESINSFFDGFVNRNTKLFEFPQKYGKAMAKRVRDETSADANCAKYIRRLVTSFLVEKFFQRLYTDTMFQEVQKECTRMMYCYCKEENMLDEKTVQYILEDRVWVVPEGRSGEIITDRRRYYSATYNRETNDVCCNCSKFVTTGIMCKHMMRILDQNRVVQIPEIYVVNRWRKDILRKHTRVQVSYHDPNKSVAVQRYNKLMGAFASLCDEATMLNDEAVELVTNGLMNIRSEFDKVKNSVEQESISMLFPDEANDSGMFESPSTTFKSTGHKPSSDTCPPSCDVIVKDPVVTKKRRGRPKGLRQKTLSELGYKKPGDTKKSKSAMLRTDQVSPGNANKPRTNKGTAAKNKKNTATQGGVGKPKNTKSFKVSDGKGNNSKGIRVNVCKGKINTSKKCNGCKGKKTKDTAAKGKEPVTRNTQNGRSLNADGATREIKAKGDNKKGKRKHNMAKEGVKIMTIPMPEQMKVRKVKMLQDLVPILKPESGKLTTKRKTSTGVPNTRSSKSKVARAN